MAGIRMIAAMIGGIVTAATMLELFYFGNGDMPKLRTSRYRLWATVFGDDGHHLPECFPGSQFS